MTTNEKLTKLRAAMEKENLSVYIVVNADPHISEYAPAHYRERAWLSGFTGSAGTVVVTPTEAGLWTDGRYYIQAEQQLEGSEIKLFRASDVGVVKMVDYILENAAPGTCVGFNGRLMAAVPAQKLRDRLSAAGIQTKVELDLIGPIWTEGRPPLSQAPAFLYSEEYSGRGTRQKLEDVRAAMKKEGIDHLLVGALDDVNWLCNIRGTDFATTPVTTAYALVGLDKAVLYLDKHKSTPEIAEYLSKNGVQIRAYDAIFEDVKRLGNARLGYAGDSVNSALVAAVPDCCVKIPLARGPVGALKSAKNETEMKWARSRHIQDGAAVAKMIFWLKNAIGKEPLTEMSIVEKLTELRSAQEGNTGASFGTIAGYGPNGAIVHYGPEPDTCLPLKPEGFVLVDSGGQYLGATTDITRTIALGPLTEQQRTDFTLVLKAFLGLSRIRFLEGTPGKSLDVLARKEMWAHGLNYKHGTGHGVGSYLGVHESPPNFADNSTPFTEGMIISIEPGVYRQGSHGIRTENLVMAVRDEAVPDVGQFYRFEPLTQCPIDLDAIDISLLTGEEKQWLDAYHKGVYEKISGLLTDEEKVWLKEATRPIA